MIKLKSFKIIEKETIIEIEIKVKKINRIWIIIMIIKVRIRIREKKIIHLERYPKKMMNKHNIILYIF